ncbi:lysophospholipid acyltransferase family protein [Planctomicrobium sp. SH661]|uniref:lysophospholipid acyltransferase family protein n=1 Tax=Planctomicrobium sp. SH661 TaxID=3448124 RepID=UPI003F5BDEED
MNPQPYQNPPRWWPSRLSPWFVRAYSRSRNRELQQQGITGIDVEGAEKVGAALQAGCGVLLVSNHSYHYDSYVLIESGRRAGWFPQIMTAWQVFMMYGPAGRWVLQRHGCFSINREGNDTQAFRQAVSILEAGENPLLIYPEGDIYHSNDRVMPFREGAAAIALLARKKNVRPLVIIPTATKCFYITDPTAQLHAMMDQLEKQIGWRPVTGRSLLDRIYRFGNGFLSLKEIEHLGSARTGTVRERLAYLANAVLTQIRERHGLPPRGNDLTERIRHLRIHLIRAMDKLRSAAKLDADGQRELRQYDADMQDLFFVTQLSSYHGDYSSEKPTIERMAETIDKFEEDIFALQAPTPRGERRACVRFGDPIELAGRQESSAQLTLLLEAEVQKLLDRMNESGGNCESPVRT